MILATPITQKYLHHACSCQILALPNWGASRHSKKGNRAELKPNRLQRPALLQHPHLCLQRGRLARLRATQPRAPQPREAPTAGKERRQWDRNRQRNWKLLQLPSLHILLHGAKRDMNTSVSTRYCKHMNKNISCPGPFSRMVSKDRRAFTLDPTRRSAELSMHSELCLPLMVVSHVDIWGLQKRAT